MINLKTSVDRKTLAPLPKFIKSHVLCSDVFYIDVIVPLELIVKLTQEARNHEWSKMISV